MCKFNMFITAVCVLFLIKLRWPKNKSVSVYFCKNAKTTLRGYMQCGNVRLLSSGGFGHLNDLNFNNSVFIAHPTSNQLKACSCIRSWTSASSLTFTTSTLVQGILLYCKQVKAINNCSFFQIQLNSAVGIFICKSWAPSFVISNIWSQIRD